VRDDACSQAAVDAVPLESITPEKVRIWKKEYVNRAGRDQLVRRRRVVNVNSYLRRARALFAKKIRLKSVALTVSPFDGVALERRTDTKFYGAGVDPLELLRPRLMNSAKIALKSSKRFCLGSASGGYRPDRTHLGEHSLRCLCGRPVARLAPPLKAVSSSRGRFLLRWAIASPKEGQSSQFSLVST
jgi:hypothetical protein